MRIRVVRGRVMRGLPVHRFKVRHLLVNLFILYLSPSNSSDSTDSNQPIPIHFKCKDIEFTKITFTDELEKEKKKMEKAKLKLEQEKIKMRQIREGDLIEK